MKKSRMTALIAGAAAIGAGALYLDRGNNTLETNAYSIKKGLREPITVVSLADLHGKRFIRPGNDILSRVRALKPDIVAFPGDTVSADMKGLSGAVRLVGELAKHSSVVMIPGNHERRSGRCREIMALFSEAGATVLQDEIRALEIKGTPVHILGLCEPIGESRKDYLRAEIGTLSYPDNAKLLLDLARREGLRIVLSHFPETFALTGECAYKRYDFDLMLSGHAHGGQIRLPEIGGLFAPGQGIFPKYTSGLYGGDGPALVVSRGLGNDTLIPRINNRPEIAVVTVM